MIFTYAIVYISEDGVAVCSIDILRCKSRWERVGFEVVAGESSFVEVVERCGNPEIIGACAGDDTTMERRSRGRVVFTEIVDKDSGDIISIYAVVDIDIRVWVSKIGRDSVVRERVDAAREIDTIGGAVAYLGVEYGGVDILQHQSIDRVVVDASVREC